MEAEITPAIVFLCILFLCIALIVTIYTFFASKKIAKADLAKKKLELEFQEELLHQTLMAQETERKRIAQDIHDEISGKINVVNLQIQLVRNTFEAGNDATASLSDIYRQGVLISESARRIAHNLLPPTLESFGLKAALLEHLDEVNKTNTISIYFKSNADLGVLPTEYQLHIFRIVQELVTNSLRHGHATEATFNIHSDKKIYHGVYTDNGIGFNTMSQKSSGLGMQNIKSRVQFMNGKMIIFSKPGQGFHLNFEFLWK